MAQELGISCRIMQGRCFNEWDTDLFDSLIQLPIIMQVVVSIVRQTQFGSFPHKTGGHLLKKWSSHESGENAVHAVVTDWLRHHINSLDATVYKFCNRHCNCEPRNPTV